MMLIAFTHLHAAHAQVSIQLQQVNHHLRAQHCWCAVPLHTIARCVGIGSTHLRRMEATGQTCVGAHCILPYSTTGSGFHHLGPNFKHGVRRWSSVGSNHCWLWPWNNLHIEVRKAYGGWVLEIWLRERQPTPSRLRFCSVACLLTIVPRCPDEISQCTRYFDYKGGSSISGLLFADSMLFVGTTAGNLLRCANAHGTHAACWLVVHSALPYIGGLALLDLIDVCIHNTSADCGSLICHRPTTLRQSGQVQSQKARHLLQL